MTGMRGLAGLVLSGFLGWTGPIGADAVVDWNEITMTAEVAARLDQPLGTIKTRIRSALGKLRRVLSTGVNTR